MPIASNRIYTVTPNPATSNEPVWSFGHVGFQDHSVETAVPVAVTISMSIISPWLKAS